jgi:hypothetical protein
MAQWCSLSGIDMKIRSLNPVCLSDRVAANTARQRSRHSAGKNLLYRAATRKVFRAAVQPCWTFPPALEAQSPQVGTQLCGCSSSQRIVLPSLENFLRVETFGTPNHHWLHVTVEPNEIRTSSPFVRASSPKTLLSATSQTTRGLRVEASRLHQLPGASGEFPAFLARCKN